MTITTHKMQVFFGPERRRRWSTAEKLAIIQETCPLLMSQTFVTAWNSL